MTLMNSGLGGVAGYGENSFKTLVGAVDDTFTSIDLTSVFGPAGINFFGTYYTSLFLGTNGIITFNTGESAFSASGVAAYSQPAIVPYWSDVHIGVGGDIYWDLDPATGKMTITWDHVKPYGGTAASPENSFQVVLTNVGSGNFNVDFIYQDMNWTDAAASVGVAPTVGVTNGGAIDYELEGSGNMAFLLTYETNDFDVNKPIGVWSMQVINGVPTYADGVVDGTAGGDLIDYNYTGDPEGDLIDHNDAIGFNGTNGNDDFVRAGDGNDTILSGDGNDQIYAGNGNDQVSAGVGNDLIYGEAGNDSLNGDAGNDSIYGGDGSDLIFSGDGNDQVFGDAGNDYIDGGLGDDTIFGGDGDDQLTDGDGGNDLIEGGAGNDSINSNTGFDTLKGDDGNDYIDAIGSSGTVTVYGGTGDDSIYGTWTAAGDSLMGDAGDDKIAGNGGNDTIDGGDGNDFVDAGDNNDLVYGGLGNDTLDGGSGADTLMGGAGDDSLIGGWPNDAGDLADYLSGGDGNDTARGGEGDDTLFGDAGNDVLYGGNANDVLDGGTGDDQLFGDAGNDSIVGGDGNDSIDGGTGNDQLFGNAGDDTVIGGDGDDVVDGDAGNDVLFGGLGNDTLVGDEGNDSLNAGAGNDQLYGGIGNDTFDGGAGADSVFAGDDADVIYGGANDTVIGGEGGNDNDTLILSGVDHITFGGGNNEAGTVTFADGSTMVFSEIENIQVTGAVDGTSGNDTISGGYVDLQGDQIDGSDGVNDTVFGYAGNDVIMGLNGNDTVFGGADNDSIFGNLGDDVLYGDDGVDVINGDQGNDTIYGGAGNDALNGGIGNDALYGGVGNDNFAHFDGFGNDTVVGGETGEAYWGDQLQISTTVGVNVVYTGNEAGLAVAGTDSVTFSEIETLATSDANDFVDGSVTTTGINVFSYNGNDTLIGGSGNDVLSAGDGADSLTGGAGDDQLIGGYGNDTLVVGDAAGNDILQGGEDVSGTDIDRVDASSMTTGATLTFTGAEAGTLTQGSNIGTFSQIEQFQLGLGNDTVLGGLGNESVDGGAGNDSMSGGAGNDTFAGGLGADTISTGDDADVIYGGANDVVIGGEGGNDNDTLILSGVDHITYGGGNNEAGTVTFADGSTMTFSEIENIQVTGAVDGTGGNDTIGTGYIDAQGDQLDGTDGLNDTIFGYAGNDSIDGVGGDDTIYGGVGNDTAAGGLGNDVVSGDEGNDSLGGFGGNDTIYGGTGDDTVLGDGENDILYGDAGNDLLFGGTGDDLVYGGDGNDQVNMQNAENDTVYGGLGNDTIRAGANLSNTLIDGGAGFDAYTANGSANPMNVVFSGSSAGTMQVGTNAINTFTSIERLILSTGNDTVDASADTIGSFIQSDAGEDSVLGGSGNDTLWGGNGNDTVNGGAGADSMDGGDGNDLLIGGAGNDSVSGGYGNDTLVVGNAAGNDLLIGGEDVSGADIDRVDASSMTTGATLTFTGAEVGTLTQGSDVGTFSQIEQFALGSGNDTVLGGLGNESVDGGAGNDSMSGGAGNDTFAGGLGADTLSGGDDADVFYGGANDVVIGGEGGNDNDTLVLSGVDHITFGGGNNEAGTVTFADGSTMTFSEIENIQVTGAVDGTGGNDTIGNTFVDAQGDQVDGTDGLNDTIFGYAGNDNINAGSGNDTIFGGVGDDAVFGMAGTDLVYGGDGNDVFASGSDSLSGDFGGGNDTLLGEAGNDLFEIKANGANATIIGGENPGDIDSLYTVYNGTGGATITFTGNEAGTLTFTDGTSVATFSEIESARGTLGNDVLDASVTTTGMILDGFLGNDSITGGAGNDSLIGGDGNDTVAGGAGADTLFGDNGNDLLNGGTGADAVYGGAGDDTFALQDGFGNDTIAGGESGETSGDVLDASAVTGNITVDLSAGSASNPEDGTLSLAGDVVTFSEIESIILGSGNDTLTGSTGNDNVAMGAGNDVVNAGAGNDKIDAGTGADTITGGSGNDSISLGASDGANDVLILASGSGQDIISQFEAPVQQGDGSYVSHDQLNVAGLTDASGNPVNVSDVTVTSDGSGNAVLTFPNGESITLVGISAASINSPGALHAMGIPLDPDLKVDGTAASDTMGVGYTDTMGDQIDGTDGNNDTIFGYAGNDTIIAGLGDDTVYGGADNDLVLGADGNDTVYGDAGDDTLYGEAGVDAVIGGDGNDLVYGGDGNDSVYGGLGNDVVDGGTGNDLVLGGEGADQIYGGDGNDQIYGGIGNNGAQADLGDTIYGGAGIDQIDANFGNDVVYGGTEGDRINGQEGSDLIYGGSGNDILSGYQDGFGIGVDDATADTLFGGTGEDWIYGGGGDDSLNGGDGNDSALGGEGNDTIAGEGGSDTLEGGNGDDLIFGGADYVTPPGLTVWANDPSSIYRIDIDSNGVAVKTLVGPAARAYGDIGMDPNGTLYGVSGGQLYSINTSTGAETFVGNIGGGAGGNALSFGPDGMGYAASGSSIYRFDPQTPATSAPWWTNPTGGYPAGDFLFVGDKAYVSWVDTISGQTQLLKFDLDGNGNVISEQALGTLPGTAWGLAAGANGEIFTVTAVNGVDALFQLDVPTSPLAGGLGAIPLTEVIGSENTQLYWGATSNYEAHLGGGADLGDLLNGGAGNDTIYGGFGNDTISGGVGNDYLYGGSEADTLTGDAGNDLLSGGDGNDSLDGGADNDTLYGDAANDTLIGGAGADALYGGDDRDTFIAGSANDAIGDVVDGGEGGDDYDVLDLSAIGFDHTNIIYDPLNHENGTVQFLDDLGNVTGTMQFSNIEKIIACFTPGSMILTDQGEVAVEDLVEGDRVLTRDAGFQPIRWIGRRDLSAAELVAEPRFLPVKIAKGALGANLPERDMMVSPQHRMLVTGTRAELLFGEYEVLVAATHMVGTEGITRAQPASVSYIHMLFDEHQVVRADGAWSESFQPGVQTLGGLEEAQREEILALFPELRLGHAFASARLTLKAKEAQVLLRA